MKGGWRPARPGEVPALPTLPAGGVLLNHGRGAVPTNPITHPMELALELERLCGAEGYRIEGGVLLALRFDTDGNERVIDRFEMTMVNA